MPRPSSPTPDVELIPGTGLFQDTAGTTPATADGDPVGKWTDQGALGFSPTQATAGTRPTFVADSGFKSQPAVRYSATQNLTGVSMPLANSRTKGTLMAAFRSDVTSPPGGAIFSTTQDQLGILSDGRFALNTAAVEYGTMPSGAKSAMLSLAGGQILTGVYDGTQTGNAARLRLFRNLVEETLTYTGTISAVTYAGGQGLFLGREAGGSGWAHTALRILFWRAQALSTVDRLAWENYLAETYFTKTTSQLVVQGDSNAVGSPNNTSNPWPSRVTTTMGWATVSNNSTVGFKLAQGSTAPNIEKRDDWHAHQPYVLALGTNDLAVDHASLVALQGYFNAEKTKLTDARYPIFAFTIPESASSITGGDETTRVTYNSWLAGLAGITVIDVATALGSSLGANFEGDNLHLSTAGHTVVTNAVVAAFRAAFPAPGGVGLLGRGLCGGNPLVSFGGLAP